MSGYIGTLNTQTGFTVNDYAWRVGMSSGGNVGDNGTIFLDKTTGGGCFLLNVTWASDKVTIPVDGYYELGARVQWNANGVMIAYYYDFTNNKGIASQRWDSYDSESTSYLGTLVKWMAAGTIVGLRNASGGTRFLMNGTDADGTFMEGKYMGHTLGNGFLH